MERTSRLTSSHFAVAVILLTVRGSTLQIRHTSYTSWAASGSLMASNLNIASWIEYKDSVCSSLRAVFPQVKWGSLIPALGICASVFAQSTIVDPYISTESPIAKAGVLANIGPNGVKSSGAHVSSRCTRLSKTLIRNPIPYSLAWSSPALALPIPTTCTHGSATLPSSLKHLLTSTLLGKTTLSVVSSMTSFPQRQTFSKLLIQVELSPLVV